jgi:hypothetical protein
MVICDSSPLLVTTESIVLSSQVGQVLLVVNAWKTPQQAIVHAVEKLDSSVPIGIVLNRADEGEGRRYGYGYGAYHEASQAAQDAEAAKAAGPAEVAGGGDPPQT